MSGSSVAELPSTRFLSNRNLAPLPLVNSRCFAQRHDGASDVFLPHFGSDILNKDVRVSQQVRSTFASATLMPWSILESTKSSQFRTSVRFLKSGRGEMFFRNSSGSTSVLAVASRRISFQASLLERLLSRFKRS